MKLYTYPKTHVTVDLPGLSARIFNNLKNHINDYLVRYLDDEKAFYVLERDMGGWELVTNKGKLSKRILNTMYKSFDLRPGDDWVAELGGILKDAKASNNEYLIDVVDDFGWNKWEFGNPRSCYWTEYRNSRTTIRENGGMCLRLYDDDEVGVGRFWIFEKYGELMGFNPYGRWTIDEIGSILSQLYNDGSPLDVRAVRMVNSKSYHMPYINNDVGYVFSTSIYLDDEVDLGWKEYDNDYDSYNNRIIYTTCVNCGERCRPEYTYESNGLSYCSSCYTRLCSVCHEVRDGLSVVDFSNGLPSYVRMCYHCAEDMSIAICSNCNSTYYDPGQQPFVSQHKNSSSNGRMVCQTCQSFYGEEL